jgi:hypothetical protein
VTPTITLTDALADTRLMGETFKASSFWTWRVVAKLIDGLPLTARESALFEQCTGRAYQRSPEGTFRNRAFRRLIILVGRRGGKDRFLSAVAVWRAALCADWLKHMSAGEQAVVLLLGADRKQAAILRRYCQGLLATPLLAAEVTRLTTDVIEFRNGSSLEIGTNDAQLIRGRSAIAVLGSECCHWKTDETSASSDEEVVGAAEPSMAMCPDGGLLLLGSSVHRKRGYMFRRFKELHGDDAADDLCWFAPSRVMNPRLPQAVIERALANDVTKARAEYENMWREEATLAFERALIEAAQDDVTVRPYDQRHAYFAFTDASSGTQDAFAAAVAHRETDTLFLDCLIEIQAPFNTATATAQVAETLKAYGCRSVMADDHAKGWLRAELSRHGVSLEPRPQAHDGSVFHLEVLPLFSAGRVRLLRNARLVAQYCGLERRPRGDREWIGHAKGQHDDLCVAVSGALWRASKSPGSMWRSDAMIERTAPPGKPSALVTSLVANGRGEIGCVYFQIFFDPGKSGHQLLYLIDIDVKSLTPQSLRDVQARREELAQGMQLWHPSQDRVFAQAIIAEELDRVLGRQVGAEAIDVLLGSDLPLTSALHVGAGEIKVADAVLQKPLGLGFLDGAPGRDDDALRLAFLTGVVASYHGIPVGPRRASVNANLKNR